MRWLVRYNLRWLVADVIAGLTVGLMVVPQALAYAHIARLPLHVRRGRGGEGRGGEGRGGEGREGRGGRGGEGREGGEGRGGEGRGGEGRGGGGEGRGGERIEVKGDRGREGYGMVHNVPPM